MKNFYLAIVLSMAVTLPSFAEEQEKCGKVASVAAGDTYGYVKYEGSDQWIYINGAALTLAVAAFVNNLKLCTSGTGVITIQK